MPARRKIIVFDQRFKAKHIELGLDEVEVHQQVLKSLSIVDVGQMGRKHLQAVEPLFWGEPFQMLG